MQESFIPPSSALVGICIFGLKKKKSQPQRRKTCVKPRICPAPLSERSDPSTSTAQPRGVDYLVIVYQRELFARIAGIHLSAPKNCLRTLTTVDRVASISAPQRWKCLKCKCATTPGQPPPPPGKCLNTAGPGGEC